MKRERIGLGEKAMLLASNLAVMTTLGFGACLLVAHA